MTMTTLESFTAKLISNYDRAVAEHEKVLSLIKRLPSDTLEPLSIYAFGLYSDYSLRFEASSTDEYQKLLTLYPPVPAYYLKEYEGVHPEFSISITGQQFPQYPVFPVISCKELLHGAPTTALQWWSTLGSTKLLITAYVPDEVTKSVLCADIQRYAQGSFNAGGIPYVYYLVVLPKQTLKPSALSLWLAKVKDDIEGWSITRIRHLNDLLTHTKLPITNQWTIQSLEAFNELDVDQLRADWGIQYIAFLFTWLQESQKSYKVAKAETEKDLEQMAAAITAFYGTYGGAADYWYSNHLMIHHLREQVPLNCYFDQLDADVRAAEVMVELNYDGLIKRVSVPGPKKLFKPQDLGYTFNFEERVVKKDRVRK